jgi:hypothetical protein
MKEYNTYYYTMQETETEVDIDKILPAYHNTIQENRNRVIQENRKALAIEIEKLEKRLKDLKKLLDFDDDTDLYEEDY